MTVIHLNLLLELGHFSLSTIEEMADRCCADSLLTNNGFSPASGVKKVRQTISRKSQGSEVLTHGSVSMYSKRLRYSGLRQPYLRH